MSTITEQANARNKNTFLQDVNAGAYGISSAGAKLVTGATDELAAGTSRILTTVGSGTKSSLIDVGTGTESALFSAARGIEAIGKIGLGGGIGGGIQEITSKTGVGIGEGLEGVGTGAGKGLLNFSKAIIPAAVVAVLTVLALGVAKGVSR